MKKFVFFLLFLVVPKSVEAVTRYAGGGATTNCTTMQNSSTPSTTIQAALNCTVAGDRIEIKGGTYSETINTMPSGTSGAHITIASFGSDTVTFDYNMIWVPLRGEGSTPDVSYVDFIGGCTSGINRTCRMIFDNNRPGNSWEWTGMVHWYPSHHIVFDGVRMTGAGGAGFLVAAAFNIYRNCRVDNNGKFIQPVSSQANYGWYMGGSDNLVDNCEIDHNGSFGLQVRSDDQFPSRNEFRYNLIHHNGVLPNANGVGGMFIGTKNVNGSDTDNSVHHNVFFSNPGSAIQVGSEINFNFYNNTVYDNGQPGEYAAVAIGLGDSGPTTNIVLRNNALFNNHAGNFYNETYFFTPTPTYSNNACDAAGLGCTLITSTASVGFIDPASGDFRLSSASSPLVNVGTTQIRGTPSPNPCPSSFVTGTTRGITGFVGSCPDLGAYEFGVAPGLGSIAINAPTTDPNLITTANATSVSGNAVAPSSLTVSSVTWASNRGPSGTAICTNCGTPLATWSAINIPLTVNRVNTLTFTMTDSVGGTVSTVLNVRANGAFRSVVEMAFNEGSGTTVADTSGLGNNGTFTGTGNSWAGAGNGKYSNAVVLNGSGGISIPDADSLDLSIFTLEAEVYPTTAGDYMAAISKSDLVGGHKYFLHAALTGYCGPRSPLGGYSFDPGGGAIVCDPPALPLNQWSHIAVTYDGANLRFYLNAVLKQTVPASDLPTESPDALLIGNSQYGEGFIGRIDQVRIYNADIPLTDGANACGSPPSITRDMNNAIGCAVGDTTGPAVAITSHTNGQTVSASPITVSGTASDSGLGNSGITGVTVNAVAVASGGTAAGAGTASWTSQPVTLVAGANTITAIATDGAANTTSTSITVNLLVGLQVIYGSNTAPVYGADAVVRYGATP